MRHPIVKYGPGVHVGDYMLAQTIDRDNVIDKAPKVVHGYRLDKLKVAGKDVAMGDGLDACACGRLEIDWLPFAAEQYHISPDIHDYVLVEVPIVVASYPNRNLDAFPYEELTAWRTSVGRPSYASFIGKPVHQDHDNQDDAKAKGVIFDATLVSFRGRWHVKILKGFDRSKDKKLADLVQKKNRVGHSMGALVEQTECSSPSCRYLSDGVTTCQHIAKGTGKGDVIDGHLIYELLRKFVYVESSSVADPAYTVALSDYFLNF